MGVFGSLPIRSPLSCLWWYSENFVSPQLLTATSAHIEKHLLNSGRLRGLMPTHTEKQTILSTHRRNADTNVPTQAPPRKKKKKCSDRNAQTTQAPAYPETLRYPRRTELQTRFRASRCGVCAHAPHKIPLGAQSRRHATLSPTHETPHWLSLSPPRLPLPPRRPPFPRPLSFPPPPPKDVQNTPQNKPPAPGSSRPAPRQSLPHSFSPVAG